MSAQADGDYAEAMENYEEALTLEENPIDRSYILYNMGLIEQSNGQIEKALEYYQQSIELNPRNCSALNNVAVLLHYQGEQAKEADNEEEAETLFDSAAKFWVQAIRIAPGNYIEAQNWLKMTGRANIDAMF